MPQPVSRRTVLVSALALPAAAALSPATTAFHPAAAEASVGVSQRLAALERRYDARIGVFAQNLRTGRTVHYRSGERFPILSTFKTLACANVLKNYDRHGEVLSELVRYTADELVVNSPITSQHVETGMSIADLCAAAIQYSDNTAGNLILQRTGGPASIGRFARTLGDHTTRLDRWEPALNTAIPGDRRDTTTPASIGHDYLKLILGNELRPRDRAQLTSWLLGNTTSALRFRAGLPAGWTLADKTGGGDYGTINDIGVAWTTRRTPLLLTAQTRKASPDAVGDPHLLADIAQLLAAALAPGE
jgi:beta-lactamase class A